MPVRSRGLLILALLVGAFAVSGPGAGGAYAAELRVSDSASRTEAEALGGQTYPQESTIYVFVPSAGVETVRWYLDDPSMSRSPRRVEYVPSFDFDGTASDGRANDLALAELGAGTHTITAEILGTDGDSDVVSATFTVKATLLFSDEFGGTSVDEDRWNLYYSPGHAGYGLRRPSAMDVADGSLVVTAKMVDGEIVSGGMSSALPLKYGRVEFRVRTEVDPTGTMSGVVLTYPTDQWSPYFTENDMYETGAGRGTRTPFRSFIHYGSTSTTQKYFIHEEDGSDWHTMAMDWRPGALKIYRDGALVWTITDPFVIADVFHRVCIQLDARATRALTTPVRMYVDYVRVYR
jgi:hypothetical protein